MTIIDYHLPMTNQVCLKVYDLQGREMAVLIDCQMPAGKHQISWNAGDLPSGIYYYTIQVGGNIETRKMLLVK